MSETEIVCPVCGKRDTVPFTPDPAKLAPLCRMCHAERKIVRRSAK